MKTLILMRYFRFLLVLGVVCLLATTAFAQRPPKSKATSKTKANKTMFEGTIKQKPWSKSSQSFCAQGSEYYVLVQQNNEETVIQNESGEDLATFIGKKVSIEGKIDTKTIAPSNNPMEQRPVNINPMTGKEEPFKCTVLIVSKIK